MSLYRSVPSLDALVACAVSVVVDMFLQLSCRQNNMAPKPGPLCAVARARMLLVRGQAEVDVLREKAPVKSFVSHGKIS